MILGAPVPDIGLPNRNIWPRGNNLGAGISQKLPRALELAGAAALLWERIIVDRNTEIHFLGRSSFANSRALHAASVLDRRLFASPLELCLSATAAPAFPSGSHPAGLFHGRA